MIAKGAMVKVISIWVVILLLSLFVVSSWIIVFLGLVISALYFDPEREILSDKGYLSPIDGQIDKLYTDSKTGEICLQIRSRFIPASIRAPINCSSLKVSQIVSEQPPVQSARLFDFGGCTIEVYPLWPSCRISLLERFYDIPRGCRIAFCVRACIVLRMPANTRLLAAVGDSVRANSVIAESV